MTDFLDYLGNSVTQKSNDFFFLEYKYFRRDKMEKIYISHNCESITTKEAFEKFIRCKKIKNLSPETLRTYECDFSYFCNFYPSKNLCADIKKETIYGFIEYLRNNTKANPTTIYSYMTHIRAILYYFMEEGYTKKFAIEMPKK